MSENSKHSKPCGAAKRGKCAKHCACCGVGFQSDICSQCAVAGCGSNVKGDACRLRASMRQTLTLSSDQLRQRVAELEQQNSELQVESQRLAKKIFELRETRKAA